MRRLSMVMVGLLLLSTAVALSPLRTPAAVATTLGYARAYSGATSADSAIGFGVAVDTSGNAYLSGQFTGTVDFDPGAGSAQLSSVGGGTDGYGERLDANGDFRPVHLHVNGSGEDEGRGIAADAAGNSYITGTFNDISTVNRDRGYVVKRDTSGSNVWIAFFGGAGTAGGFRVAVDGAGNVYAVGSFSGEIDFNPDPGLDPEDIFNLIGAGDNDTFLVKLNSNGTFVWVKQFGGAGDDPGTGVVLDGAGNIYVGGIFSGTADFDPGLGSFPLTAAGAYDAFAVKLDATGAFVWARHVGGTSANSDGAQDIGVDAAGNVYLTGFFHETADFDPSPGGTFNLTSAGETDVFVVKLNSSGGLVWAKQFAGTSGGAASTIAVDAAGNVHVGGEFFGVIDFDPDSSTFNLTSAGVNDAFVVKLDTNGSLVWAERFGGAGQDLVNDLVLDGTGSVYMTGFFTGTVDFDPSPGTANLTSNTGDPAQTGAFVVKLVQRAPPVNVLQSASQTTPGYLPLVFSAPRGNRISVTDPENGVSPLRVSLSVTSGTVTISSASGLSFIEGDGSLDANVTFSGTVGAINAALDGMRYTPAPNGPAAANLQIITQDRSGQTDTDTVSITIDRQPVACGPRPGVSVTSKVVNGTLQATVTVTETGAPTNNTIKSIQFGTFQNATVTLNGQQIASGQAFTAPASTTSLTLVVTRTTPGQPTTVPLTVTDQCGSWPSFVGGGAGAGF